MIAGVTAIAKHLQLDPSTIRRDIHDGCPCIRKGRKGPGNGALLDLEQVARWRGRANGLAGLSVDDVVQRIAVALWECLEKDCADIRAGISREDAAAAFVVVWERCCKTFGVSFKFDAHPEPIRALMREL